MLTFSGFGMQLVATFSAGKCEALLLVARMLLPKVRASRSLAPAR
jgi:hypothetical protein